MKHYSNEEWYREMLKWYNAREEYFAQSQAYLRAIMDLGTGRGISASDVRRRIDELREEQEKEVTNG